MFLQQRLHQTYQTMSPLFGASYCIQVLSQTIGQDCYLNVTTHFRKRLYALLLRMSTMVAAAAFKIARDTDWLDPSDRMAQQPTEAEAIRTFRKDLFTEAKDYVLKGEPITLPYWALCPALMIILMKVHS